MRALRTWHDASLIDHFLIFARNSVPGCLDGVSLIFESVLPAPRIEHSIVHSNSSLIAPEPVKWFLYTWSFQLQVLHLSTQDGASLHCKRIGVWSESVYYAPLEHLFAQGQRAAL